MNRPEYEALARRIIALLYRQDDIAVMGPKLIVEMLTELEPMIVEAESAPTSCSDYGSVHMSNQLVEFSRRWYKRLHDDFEKQTVDSHYSQWVRQISMEVTYILIQTARKAGAAK